MDKKSPAKKVLLYKKIADEIHADIVRQSLDTISSVHLLAERYNTSTYTIVRAVHHLQENGVLRILRGRKTVVVKPGCREDGTTNSSVEKFTAYIRDQIGSGVFRNGQVLPKQLSFISTHHVAPNTICTAFEKLRLEQLLHKKGKKWVVGPAENGIPNAHLKKTGYAPRVVLILMHDYRGWCKRARDANDRMQSFLKELVKEFERYDIQFKFVLHDTADDTHDIFTSREKNILDLAHSLKKNYTGTLLIGDILTFPEITGYISALLQFKKPVVWFNPETNMQSGSPSMRRRGYHYCMPSHRSLIELAITTLFESGHRRIIYPVPSGAANYPWIFERFKFMEETAEKLGNGILLKRVVLDDTIWESQFFPGEDIISTPIMSIKREFLKSAESGDAAAPLSQQIREKIYSLSPSLGESIIENNATALIAPNQAMAVNYYYWLRNTGISVPEDISMITFDNIFAYSCFPISTIDWKTDDAGYNTAHIFIGILPVKTGKNRIIHHSPAFIDRGSVAAPRRHAVTFGSCASRCVTKRRKSKKNCDER